MFHDSFLGRLIATGSVDASIKVCSSNNQLKVKGTNRSNVWYAQGGRLCPTAPISKSNRCRVK